jgi:hypothetical protein
MQMEPPGVFTIPHELDIDSQFLTHHYTDEGIPILQETQGPYDLKRLIMIGLVPPNYYIYDLLDDWDELWVRLVSKPLMPLLPPERALHDWLIRLMRLNPRFQSHEIVHNLLANSSLPETPKLLASIIPKLSLSVGHTFLFYDEPYLKKQYERLYQFIAYQSMFGHSVSVSLRRTYDDPPIVNEEFIALYFPKTKLRDPVSMQTIKTYILDQKDRNRGACCPFNTLTGAKLFIWINMITESYLQEGELSLAVRSFFHITSSVMRHGDIDALQYLLCIFDKLPVKEEPSYRMPNFIPNHAIDRERMIEFLIME